MSADEEKVAAFARYSMDRTVEVGIQSTAGGMRLILNEISQPGLSNIKYE